LETYEAALEELTRGGRKNDALTALRHMVALEGSERNLVRLAELSSEIGDRKEAAGAFLKLAHQAEAAGTDTIQWYERAYSEDPARGPIAVGYAKCLMHQQQIGAAIFVLEPL